MNVTQEMSARDAAELTTMTFARDESTLTRDINVDNVLGDEKCIRRCLVTRT